MSESDRESQLPAVSRRTFVKGAAGAAAAAASASFLWNRPVAADALIAAPPPGFVPMAIPGKVVKAERAGDLRALMKPNELWPKDDVAKLMLEKAMCEFTGAPNLVESMKKFIHKDDIVAIKPNGIAGQKKGEMAFNFELIKPVVEAVIGAGVKPGNIMVYEQFPNFLQGTRVNKKGYELPEGVQTGTHNNRNHKMPALHLYQNTPVKYATFMMNATAVIDLTQIKDHSICGYTGTLKNITHGNIDVPHHHHAHNASPQIAMLYNHPLVTSRVRLHITDGFKMMYDRGPLYRDPTTTILHGGVYVSTDPVAMDTIGWQVVDKERKAHGLKSLKDSRREPTYIRTAGEFGLGVHDLNAIRLRTVKA